MVATSHDVMPDIELYQPTDEANALSLANTLGKDGWWSGVVKTLMVGLKIEIKPPLR